VKPLNTKAPCLLTLLGLRRNLQIVWSFNFLKFAGLSKILFTIEKPQNKTGFLSNRDLNHFKKLIRQKDLSTLVSNECGSDCFLCRS